MKKRIFVPYFYGFVIRRPDKNLAAKRLKRKILRTLNKNAIIPKYLRTRPRFKRLKRFAYKRGIYVCRKFKRKMHWVNKNDRCFNE